MSEPVRNAPITAALLVLLRATPIAIGDGEQPPDTGYVVPLDASRFVPYAVLYPLPGGTTDGSIAEPDDDAETWYQVTGVGASREQAETVADITRAALVGARPTLTGRTVDRIWCELLGGARRDGTAEPPVWITTDRFVVATTPS